MPKGKYDELIAAIVNSVKDDNGNVRPPDANEVARAFDGPGYTHELTVFLDAMRPKQPQ